RLVTEADAPQKPNIVYIYIYIYGRPWLWGYECLWRYRDRHAQYGCPGKGRCIAYNGSLDHRYRPADAAEDASGAGLHYRGGGETLRCTRYLLFPSQRIPIPLMSNM